MFLIDREILMLNPNYSLTQNLLESHNNMNFFTGNNRTINRIRIFFIASSDFGIHFSQFIFKLFTGIVATPHDILKGSNGLKNWTWKAAHKHLFQAMKHLAIAFILPVYTFIYLPEINLQLFKNSRIKANMGQEEREFYQTQIAKYKNKLNENQTKTQITPIENNDRIKIKNLQSEVLDLQNTIGLRERALKQKDLIIDTLTSRKMSIHEPLIYNYQLNAKEAEIRKKDAIIEEMGGIIARKDVAIHDLDLDLALKALDIEKYRKEIFQLHFEIERLQIIPKENS